MLCLLCSEFHGLDALWSEIAHAQRVLIGKNGKKAEAAVTAMGSVAFIFFRNYMMQLKQLFRSCGRLSDIDHVSRIPGRLRVVRNNLQ